MAKNNNNKRGYKLKNWSDYNKEGKVRATLIDPLWMKNAQGKPTLSQLDALDISHSWIFAKDNPDEFISVFEHLGHSKVPEGWRDPCYVEAAVSAIQTIYASYDNPEKAFESFQKMLNMFSDYDGDIKEKEIVWNSLIKIIEAEISNGEDTMSAVRGAERGTYVIENGSVAEYKTRAEKFYKSAWRFCKLADEKFPISKWNIGKSFQEDFQDKIPAEFREEPIRKYREEVSYPKKILSNDF